MTRLPKSFLAVCASLLIVISLYEATKTAQAQSVTISAACAQQPSITGAVAITNCVSSIAAGTISWAMMIAPILSGTTGSIGGSPLLLGACTSGTASVSGAAVGMVTTATPSTYPGDGVQWQSYVSSSNTVTVKVCGILAITPGASIYNVRVIQ